MSKKSFFLYSLLSILLIAGFFFYQYNKETTINIASKKHSFTYNASGLVNDFSKNEKLTNKKLAGEIIEIKGTIKKISFLNDRNTIILFGNKTSGVICDFDNKHKLFIKKLKENQQITVKGICKGFLKDVILLNCVLIDPKTNE